MSAIATSLTWIAAQHDVMCRSLRELCQINSGSGNVEGLGRVAEALERIMEPLGGEVRRIVLPARTLIDSRGNPLEAPVGDALAARKRSGAARRVFLGIHSDTVYGPDSPFQQVTEMARNSWQGPGVADAKGGLIVMLTALAALERSDLADNVGWELLVNPDEEIGSPCSAPLFAAAARRNHLGLVFEPALPDGNLVSSRKGSRGYVLVVRGKAAHVGRDITAGRNAIHALATFIAEIANLQDLERGITVNVGKIEGGGPTNVVPDLAICRLNIRTVDAPGEQRITSRLAELVENINRLDGISATLHPTSVCPPKPLNDGTQRLLDAVAQCGKQLGLELSWRPTGGVCDGNRLAAEGLPTLDTLGVRGGNLHSETEYVLLDSLVERASLSALLLLKLAAGEIELPRSCQ